MNCKQGDLAFITKTIRPENWGKITRCVRFIPEGLIRYRDGNYIEYNLWEIDPPFLSWDGDNATVVRDEVLRPIRDGEGVDETLRILEKTE